MNSPLLQKVLADTGIDITHLYGMDAQDAMITHTEMSDAELMADLTAIDVEVTRRRKSRPYEPYAIWALTARLAALTRFDHRALTRQNAQLHIPTK